MNSSAAETLEPRFTIIQKVIVIGDNPPLMAGFVNRASGLNTVYHLYASLGVGIGISRIRTREMNEVIMQLWLIPTTERVQGINNSFRRGYSGAIIVVRGNDLEALRSHLSTLKEDVMKASLAVVVGGKDDAIRAQKVIHAWAGVSPDFITDVRISDVMPVFGELLYDKHKNRDTRPILLHVTEEQCPEHHHMPGHANIPECSTEDIEFMKSLADDIGFDIKDDNALVHTDKGKFSVNLRSGAVTFTPSFCFECLHECTRAAKICIVGIDRGWSSDNIGDRALLILAKIYALQNNEIPQHIQRQIQMASQCRTYFPKKESVEVSHIQRGNLTSLLEDAEQRVSTRRLTRSAYEILKAKFNQLKSHER